ncbi:MULTISPECIES: hypothetical protein [Frankia]|uniref:Transcriptional regulator n=1 Tax=Frankia alni (strain DSM 45986 / CECT 9034 / ACN14a) TaxID=326424 RepID=Q0RLZ6_FRAAA|nr:MULTISPECIES: hypothetical protein [Frankia]CAJ61457.1 hypothetical protein FRAAL2813 [Frankia alni ACN14a]
MVETEHPQWNPALLREHRHAVGLTMEQTAEKIRNLSFPDGTTPPAATFQMIGRHERGQVYPGIGYQRAYAALYRTTRSALGFAPPQLSGPHHPAIRQSDPSLTGDGVETPGRLGHHRRTGAVPANIGLERLWQPGTLPAVFEEVTATLTASPLPRRQFLTVSGVALAAAAHEWLVADPARISAALAGRQADASVIADLNSGVDLLRRLDDKLGGQAVYGMTVEQLRLAVGLLRNASYSQADGKALHAIAAELSRMAGWTAQDTGAHGTAQRFYLLGLRAAHEADNPGIGANILRCMAEQACGRGDPRTGVELLRSARAGARGRLTATENAILAGQLAVAHGRAQDRQAARSAADEARDHIAQARPDEDPPHVYWVSAHHITYQTGVSMIFSGDPAAAIPHVRSAIDHVDPDMPRDLLEFQASLAVAHARAGDPDAAVRLAHDAIDATSLTSSALFGDSFAEVCREVHAAGHPGAKDLAEHLRAATGATSV